MKISSITPVEGPIEHTRLPKVVRGPCSPPERARKQVFQSVCLPSISDKVFKKRQQAVAASFNPDD